MPPNDAAAALIKARRTKAVDLPDFGRVHVKELSASEVEEIGRLQKSGPPAHAAYYAIRKGLCDASGTRLFTDDDKIDDIASLAHAHANAIVEGVFELSGLVKKEPDGEKKDGGKSSKTSDSAGSAESA
jgi:hypothetical protein